MIERCGGLIWSCCPRNPLGKAGEQEKKKKKELSKRTTSKFISFLDKYGIYNILGNFTSLKII